MLCQLAVDRRVFSHDYYHTRMSIRMMAVETLDTTGSPKTEIIKYNHTRMISIAL